MIQMSISAADVRQESSEDAAPAEVSTSGRFASILRRAGKRGFWPLADQGVASLGNILTILLVGRGLAKTDFGSFALILEGMLFLISMHAALITYPLTVKGAVIDADRLRHLATASLLLTLAMAVPLSIVAILVAGVYHILAIGIIGVVALVAWQMQEAVRRGMMSHFRHSEAIWGDIINYIGQAAVLLILYEMGRLTLFTTLGAMALTSILALALQTAQIGIASVTRAELVGIAKDFWASGRWVAMTNLGGLAMMFCGNWALGLSHGRDQIADFAAIAALLKICNPVVQTIAGLIVPSAAKSLASGGIAAARRISLKITVMGAALLAPPLLLLSLFPHWCLYLAYHGRYGGPEHAMSVRILVIGNILLFLNTAVSSFLNGVHQSRFSFYGQVAGSIGLFAVLLPMVIAFGWMGYVLGGLAQVFLQLVVLLFFLRKVKSPAAVPATVTA